MGLEQDLLPLLRCPKCHGAMQFSPAATGPLAGAEFGVLRCSCARYPIIDGIPILLDSRVGMFEHTTGTAQVSGVEPQRLVTLIEQGRGDDALLECLAFPILPPLVRRLLGWRLSNGPLGSSLGRWRCKRRLRADVLARRRDNSASEVFGFFYQPDSPMDIVVGDYFNLRFGQPRHLAALSLLHNVLPDDKPLLDLACGGGHLDHYLTSRYEPLKIVGTDLNFFHLWIARHWIAPTGQYVCADAGDGLPFIDAGFSGTFCSDAYHYIPNRTALHREMERCAPGRLGMLTRVGNAEVMPNEGMERTAAGYVEDIGAPDTRVFAESSLLKCYLNRRNPLEQPRDDPDTVGHSKWLSFAWNVPAKLRDAAALAREWPHAAGTLRINPIYARNSVESGLHLRFAFPSIWYAYENGGMLAYHPRRLVLERGQMEAAREGASATAVRDDLIARFVLMGMPQRFIPPQNI